MHKCQSLSYIPAMKWNLKLKHTTIYINIQENEADTNLMKWSMWVQSENSNERY
jgi:hypothetical protein